MQEGRDGVVRRGSGSGIDSSTIPGYLLRHPSRVDAAGMWQLVRSCSELDNNSCYAYLLLSTDFAATCALAERGGQIVGAVTGYIPPDRPDVLFVWQVAVARSERGKGLAGRLLDFLCRRFPGPRPFFLEATIGPSNTASRRLFTRLAQRHVCDHRFSEHFRPEDFIVDGVVPGDGAEPHEQEDLIRIGPFSQTKES